MVRTPLTTSERIDSAADLRLQDRQGVGRMHLHTNPTACARGPLVARLENVQQIAESQNRGNAGAVVGLPVAPHIAVPIPAQSVKQTVSTVAFNAVTGNTSEAAAKAIPSGTFAMAAAEGKCAGGKRGTSKAKDPARTTMTLRNIGQPL